MDYRAGVKAGLRIVARGFLFGIGFSLVFGFMLHAVNLIHVKATMARPGQETLRQQELVKHLIVSGTTEQTNDGPTVILGKISNANKNIVSGVEIVANLFNRGVFADTCSTSLSGSIAPGQSVYFKVSCGSNGKPPAVHDSYHVQATEAF